MNSTVSGTAEWLQANTAIPDGRYSAIEGIKIEKGDAFATDGYVFAMARGLAPMKDDGMYEWSEIYGDFVSIPRDAREFPDYSSLFEHAYNAQPSEIANVLSVFTIPAVSLTHGAVIQLLSLDRAISRGIDGKIEMYEAPGLDPRGQRIPVKIKWQSSDMIEAWIRPMSVDENGKAGVPRTNAEVAQS